MKPLANNFQVDPDTTQTRLTKAAARQTEARFERNAREVKPQVVHRDKPMPHPVANKELDKLVINI